MLLVPTRRRLEKLKNFCDSAMAAETVCPAMIIVDKQDFADNKDAYLDLELHHFPNKSWRIHVSEAEGMGQKVREVFPLIDQCGWVGVLNDDHYIITKNWDVKLVAQLNGHNFVTCNDRWNAPMRAAGATMFSMDLVKAFGFPLFPKQIDHLGIDNVWEEIGKHTGSWKVDMKVIIEHRHVYKDPATMDETHTRIYGTGNWDGSPESKDCMARIQKFYQEDMAGVVQRVKELQFEDSKVISVSN